jgi:hypothetical protein
VDGAKDEKNRNSDRVARYERDRYRGRANSWGVTATEIKLGQTKPYSGPASGYGIQGKAESAYFQTINDQAASTDARSI